MALMFSYISARSNEEFFAGQNEKHGSYADLKQAFYGGRKAVQWCGVVQQLDAPREAYQRAVDAIKKSFEGENAVAALIKGEGGSGKSVLLRRLAHDLCADYTVYWLESGIQSFIDGKRLFKELLRKKIFGILAEYINANNKKYSRAVSFLLL
ncbi:MAG: ATP-binding protein [Nitrospinae bacterium]|nr:ATP-binding protein [Nitrospinota bacterium]